MGKIGGVQVLEPEVCCAIIRCFRIVLRPRPALPNFFPRIPEVDLQGHIVGIATGVLEAGLFSVVTVSVGTEDGVQPGDVLQVTRPATASDSVASRPVELTEHSSAHVMIFKVFHKASFALIIKARRPVNLHDHISVPGQSSDI